MFEVGWTEMLVIAIVMIVVVGPKDLPNMLRTFGRTAAKLRGMASDFQKQFNEALKEAELDDVKKSVDELRGLSPMAEIKKQLNPFEQAAADVRAGVDAAMKPKPAADPSVPAATTPQAAEPLKNGATTMPGVSGPEAAPVAPIFPAMTDESVVASSVPTEASKASTAKKAAKAAPAVAKAAPAKATAGAKAPAKASAPAKAVRAKAVPAAKAPAKIVTAAKPEATKAAKPAAAIKAVARAEPKPAPAKKPVAKKTAGAAK
ncbi:twin-arginine translocase subunit TatB [Mesorhizobium sp. M00.F.Ca.ET.186.01.1.1]|nr:twin-arginine translocase subunit TatB [bacterium M00.F.Ca.ET.205.01.1.1]TGU47516.1 twin-arginine translocase subunit TatB [bacterium M00.F.Ca.ET.152.01.1.1]TGV32217.1 twin-arginine translocase subunit TatB [Mesorhizobium sp. M00.F.Ca.ET.186.01.1.1]TGZ39292.1 twin-arginine translocase subunit TatB [bacterium M00.F.Ca.ET.162.01.1.1]TIW59680.1 MAG: twin-arginine translocase subunit TatB [Mesorhizobium sp.]